MTTMPIFFQVFNLIVQFSNGTFNVQVQCLGSEEQFKTCIYKMGDRHKNGGIIDEMQSRRLNVPHECGPAKLIDVRTNDDKFALPYLYCMEKQGGGVVLAAMNKKQTKLGEDYMKEIK